MLFTQRNNLLNLFTQTSKFQNYKVSYHILSRRALQKDSQLDNQQQTQIENLSYVNLSSRRLLQVYGKDASQVLQGIMTNDIRLLQNEQERTSIYTTFLNGQGRIINDAFIIKPQIYKNGQKYNLQDEFWVDIDQNQYDFFKKYVKRYCLRKKIKFNDLSNHLKIDSIFNTFLQCSKENLGQSFKNIDPENNNAIQTQDVAKDNISVLDLQDEQEINYANLMYYDPRCPKLGFRIISNKNENIFEQISESMTQYQFNTIQKEEIDYNKFRILQGIAQGPEIESKLPFLVNMDFLNAIHFQKGCYIGQELTARTYHTGIIRKRLIPFYLQQENLKNIVTMDLNQDVDSIINEDFDTQLLGQQLKNSKGKNYGRVVAQYKNMGIAASPYNTENEQLNGEDLKITFGDYNGQLIYNEWLYTSIQDYIKLMNEKQNAKQRIFS